MYCESIYVTYLYISYRIICQFRYVPILSYGNLFKSYCRTVQATTIRLPINQHCYMYFNIYALSESPTFTDPNYGSVICDDLYDGSIKCIAISAHIWASFLNKSINGYFNVNSNATSQ